MYLQRWLAGGLAAGITLFLVGTAFHLLVPLVAPGTPPQFGNDALFRPWSGWTSTYMMLHPFGYGFVFAAGWLGLRYGAMFPAGSWGGLAYGVGVFGVGSLPIYLLIFAAFQISTEIIVGWTLQSFVQYALAGMMTGMVGDGATVRVSTKLSAPASRVWELLLLKETFLFITRGMMSYSNSAQWPTRILSPGAVLTTGVRLFGLAPAVPHRVQVIRVEAAQGEIATAESGGLVRVWNHRMRIEPLSDSACRYTDYIELQAGLLTPLVWLFAVIFYRHRQARWKTWLRSAAASVAESSDVPDTVTGDNSCQPPVN